MTEKEIEEVYDKKGIIVRVAYYNDYDCELFSKDFSFLQNW
jgi:hypothetical protein